MLIHGTGGVALFAAQIALALGATVIVTSSSDEKLVRVRVRVRALGAKTMNYRRTRDVATEVPCSPGAKESTTWSRPWVERI